MAHLKKETVVQPNPKNNQNTYSNACWMTKQISGDWYPRFGYLVYGAKKVSLA